MVHQEDRFKRGWSNAVWSRVRDLYHPVPEALLVDGTLLRCADCRLPARLRGRRAPEHGDLAAGPDTWCEGEECPHGVRLDLIRDPDQVRILSRPLRAFLALPLRIEEAALSELDRFGVGYEALPGELNAYRLRGDGRRVRSMHAYDRLQPTLLAARLASRTTAIADGTAVVVPRRLADRTGYRAAFVAALPEAVRQDVLLTTPEELVRDLAAVPPQATSSSGRPGRSSPGTPRQAGASTTFETNGESDA
ncbi:restriction endonuclease-related protein [Streptomyces niveus]